MLTLWIAAARQQDFQLLLEKVYINLSEVKAYPFVSSGPL